MRSTLIPLFLLASVLALVLEAQEAEACSPLPAYSLTEQLPDEGLVDVPTIGVVPLLIQTSSAREIRVTVENTQGETIPGAVEFLAHSKDEYWQSESGKLVWRSDEPLLPSTSYTLTLSGDSDITPIQVVPFTTAATAAIVSPSFSIENVRLRESVYAISQACCGDPEVDTCGRTYGTDCYAIGFSTRFMIGASFDMSGEMSRYTELAVSIDEHPSQVAYGLGYWGRVADLAGESCMTVTMTSLLDGSVDVQTACAQSQDLVVEDPPELYAADVCTSGQTDPNDPNNPVDMSEDGGCSTGSGSTSGALLVVLAAMLLFVRRKTWLA